MLTGPMLRRVLNQALPRLRNIDDRRMVNALLWRPAKLWEAADQLNRTAEAMHAEVLSVESPAEPGDNNTGKWLRFFQSMSEIAMQWANWLLDNWSKIGPILTGLLGGVFGGGVLGMVSDDGSLAWAELPTSDAKIPEVESGGLLRYSGDLYRVTGSSGNTSSGTRSLYLVKA
jgi:hypothetical protein